MNGNVPIPLAWGGEAAAKASGDAPVEIADRAGLNVGRFHMAAHLMENPSADVEFMADEFMYHYYGEKAYSLVKAVRQRLEAECRRQGRNVKWFSTACSFCQISDEALADMVRLLDQALAAPTTSETEKRRVRIREARRSVDRVIEARRVRSSAGAS